MENSGAWSKRYGRARLALLCAPAWMLAASLPVLAGGLADSPWQITADRMSRFENPPSVVAEGNVVMRRRLQEGTVMPTLPHMITPKGDMDAALEAGEAPAKAPMVIKGDWLRYDIAGNTVKIRGHAALDSDEEHVTAEAATLNLDDNTGTLSRATIYFPTRGLYVAGDEIKRTGELTYELVDGWVTKCDPETGKAPPWSFAWSKAKITYEGFAHFTNARLRVKDVPVMYSPYFGFSTNRRRKTGFLLPEWSQGGRDGVGVLVPLFLNLSPSHDATIYAGGNENRGPILAGEFRYVQDYDSKGGFMVNYMSDRKDDTPGDDFKSDGYYRTGNDRYWIRGKIDHAFTARLRGKLDVDLVSDRDYLQEYEDGMIGFEESNKRFKKAFGRGFDSSTTYVRTNTAQLSMTWPDMSLNAELRAVQDLTDAHSTDHLWSLPKISFDGRKTLLEPTANPGPARLFLEGVDLAWETEYVYYWRENGVGSQRLDLHPQLKAPVPLTPYLETTMTVGLRSTSYLVDDNSDVDQGYGSGLKTRTMSDFELATSTILMRDFDVSFGGLERLTHMVRPEVTYNYVPTEDQNDYPNLDGTDRISAVNLLTYGINNDFEISRSDEAGRETRRKLGYVKVKQSYDIAEERRDDLAPGEEKHPFSDIAFESVFDPFSNVRLGYKSDWSVYGEGMVKYELASRLSDHRGDSLNLEYRYEKGSEIRQLNADMTVVFSDTLLAQAVLAHSFYADEVSDARLRLYYHPACWSLEFLAANTADGDYRFTLVVNLAGVGNVLGVNQTLYSLDSGGYSFSR